MMVYESYMYPYVRRNLRRRYPKEKGWKIFHQDDWGGDIVDFIVERRNRRGVIERAIVEVKRVTRLTWEHVNQVNRYARDLAGGNTRIVKKILVVPSGSDVRDVPPDFSIMYLRSFQCVGNRISHKI